MRTTQETLFRKQYLVTEEQIKKIERLAKAEGTSATEMVRQAIDAYDPDTQADSMDMAELIDLVHSRLKEAIQSTQEATRTVSETLEKLSKGEE